MVAGVMALAQSLAHADLIVHYTFDNTANFGADTGSGLPANGAPVGSASFSHNGLSGGYTLNTGDGNNNYLSTGSDVAKLDGLNQLTISGWLNLQAAPNAGATVDRLLSKWENLPGTGQRGFDLSFAGPPTGSASASNFALRLQINGQTVTSTAATGANQSWLFFAVTYDASTGNTLFFTGTDSQSVSQLGTLRTLAGAGAVGDSAAPLEIGGTPATPDDRSPSAYFDDIRIYDTLLTAVDLENIRAANVPEPATAGFVLGGVALVSVLRKKRATRGNQ